MADTGADRGLGEKTGQQVLSRLLQARDQARLAGGGAPELPQPQPVTVKRAALNAVSRAVDHLYHLPTTALELTPSAITLAEMAELLPQPALLAVVEGEGEAIGVVAICPSMMTALIEMHTLGRLTARPLDPRKPTRSDAIICADFVNALLDHLGHEITALDGFQQFGGFRYASFVEDQRAMLLMLDDAPYRSLRYRLKLGSDPASREGDLFLALPQKPAIAALSPPAAPSSTKGVVLPKADAKADILRSGRTQLAAQMAAAPIDVVGVLCRRALRLGDLRNLQAGQILPLPRLDLSQARLETRSGQLLAIGKLGEAEGNYAIRLRRQGEVDPGESPHDLASHVDVADAALMSNPAATGQHEPPMVDLTLPDSFRAASAAEDQVVAATPRTDAGQGLSTAGQQKKAIAG